MLYRFDEKIMGQRSIKKVIWIWNLDIIKKWIFPPYNTKIENINEEIKNNIMEFINAPIGYNNLITEFHLQAYYKSHLLDFPSWIIKWSSRRIIFRTEIFRIETETKEYWAETS
jgi:hypothetical protein